MRRFRRRVARVRRRTGRFRKSRRQPVRRFKKRFGTRKTSYVNRNRTIVPDQFFTKVRYTDFDILADAGGAAKLQNYFGNGIYKPKNTTLADPFGITEYAALYTWYTVFASSIKVTYTNNNGVDCILLVFPDDSQGSYAAASFTTLNFTNGIPYAHKKWVTGVNSTSAGGTMGTGSIKHFMDTSKIEGITKRRVIDDDLYSSTVGTANPNKTWNWNVMAAPVDFTSSWSINCFIEITYYVKFFERKDFT